MRHARSMKRALLLVASLLSACAAAANPVALNSASRGSAAAPPTAQAPRLSGAFLAGRFAAGQNDLGFASDELLHALALDPSNQMLRQQAFLATLLAGRPEARRLAERLPDYLSAQLYLVNADATSGHWSAAEARLSALPRQGLAQLVQPMLLSWIQLGGGHPDAALATLRPFLDGQRFRFVYALHAALIADLAGRIPDATRFYHTAQAEYGAPTLELARMVASWQARQGHLDEAVQTLRATVELNPDTAISYPALVARPGERVIRNATDGMAEVYLMLASALRQQEANDLSAVLLRLSLQLRPDFTAARLLSADVEEASRHWDSALAALAPVSADDPLIAVVRLRQAELQEQAGDTDAALAILAQLAHDYPERAEPWAMKGDLLRAHHRYSEAVDAYDGAMKRIPKPAQDDWPLFYDRGIALERAHDWSRAEADFQHALALAPDQPYVLNYLGYSWAEQGQHLGEARNMIERAVQQRPDDGAIIDSLGWVLLRQGDAISAVKALERAVELVPEDATINGHLGDAYWETGRRLEALYQWRRAMTLDPEPDEQSRLQGRLHEAETALGITPGAAPTASVQTATP